MVMDRFATGIGSFSPTSGRIPVGYQSVNYLPANWYNRLVKVTDCDRFSNTFLTIFSLRYNFITQKVKNIKT